MVRGKDEVRSREQEARHGAKSMSQSIHGGESRRQDKKAGHGGGTRRREPEGRHQDKARRRGQKARGKGRGMSRRTLALNVGGFLHPTARRGLSA